MTPRKGEYGFDAPYVPFFMALGGVPLWYFSINNLLREDLTGAAFMAISGAFLWASAGTFIYTTRAGKFKVWNELLNSIPLNGNEKVLDVGCGRGAVLLLAAQKLTTGKATGIDLWQAQDQSGNSALATEKNAKAEGVTGVELLTGDMRALPFSNNAFDVIVSSLAIHNVPDAIGREKSIQEIARVLKPGGQVLLADFKFTKDYAQTLRASGLINVQTQNLGIRFWYGGPWAATALVKAEKP
jgi:arsenite methyltransferase